MAIDISVIDQALRDAGIPIDGVATVPDPSMADPNWFLVTRTIDNLTIRVDFRPEATQTHKDQAVQIIQTLDVRPRRTRPLAAIYNDLTSLSSAQQDAIIFDLQLTSLNGKWSTMRPPQDGPAAVARWAASSLAGASAAEKRQAAGWIVAMYTQQNPKYLVNPPQAPAINIPGDEPIPDA